MNRKTLVFKLLFAGCLAAIPVAAAADQAAAKPASLYTRLGGYDAIAAVSDDFLGRLAADPSFGKFFVGLSTDSETKLRQHVVEFLCNATGGPCTYLGRDMKTAHAGLGITEKDWQISVTHLTATLDKFKVPEKERGEVLAAVSSLKPLIVEKP